MSDNTDFEQRISRLEATVSNLETCNRGNVTAVMRIKAQASAVYSLLAEVTQEHGFAPEVISAHLQTRSNYYLDRMPADGYYGTADDVASAWGDEGIFSKNASIAIGGQVLGTSVIGDQFGFVSQQIGALSVHGVKIPLTPGHGDVTNTHFILGATRDVTVHEVA